VYVIEDGKARQQIVTLGSHEGKQWEIVEGLKGSEVLAASQLNQLATGMSVSMGEGGNRGDASGGGGPGRGRGRGDGQGQSQGGGQ
jgi:hypothetical protein